MASGVKLYPIAEGAYLPLIGEGGALTALADNHRLAVMGPDPDDAEIRAGAITVSDFADYLASETQAIHDATEAIYDAFDDRYLGAFASAPTVDNDGDALAAGMQYFNTTDDQTYIHNGTTWLSTAYVSASVAITGGTIDGVTITNADVTTTDLTVTGALDISGATSITGLPGELLGVQIITTAGANTYTKTAGTGHILLVIVGAGGGGGNGNSGTTGTTLGAGAGGGAGQIVTATLDVTGISTGSVTIGAAGAGATAAGANGSAGGDTIWDDGTDTLTAKGGSGGAGNEDRAGAYATTRTNVTATDNSGVTGHIQDIPPAPGGRGSGIVESAISPGGGIALGGDGANGQFGRGGDGGRVQADDTSDNGTAAVGYGAGGGGGACLGNATNGDGGDGTGGFALIYEYQG